MADDTLFVRTQHRHRSSRRAAHARSVLGRLVAAV